MGNVDKAEAEVRPCGISFSSIKNIINIFKLVTVRDPRRFLYRVPIRVCFKRGIGT